MGHCLVSYLLKARSVSPAAQKLPTANKLFHIACDCVESEKNLANPS